MCGKLLVTVLLTCLGSACVSTALVLTQENSADLSFARQHAPGSLPGRFTRLDGKTIPGDPARIRVPSGRHTVEYNCPDVLTLDTYPTVRAEFTAGRSYVLHCDANLPGVVRER